MPCDEQGGDEDVLMGVFVLFVLSSRAAACSPQGAKGEQGEIGLPGQRGLGGLPGPAVGTVYPSHALL